MASILAPTMPQDAIKSQTRAPRFKPANSSYKHTNQTRPLQTQLFSTPSAVSEIMTPRTPSQIRRYNRWPTNAEIREAERLARENDANPEVQEQQAVIADTVLDDWHNNNAIAKAHQNSIIAHHQGHNIELDWDGNLMPPPVEWDGRGPTKYSQQMMTDWLTGAFEATQITTNLAVQEIPDSDTRQYAVLTDQADIEGIPAVDFLRKRPEASLIIMGDIVPSSWSRSGEEAIVGKVSQPFWESLAFPGAHYLNELLDWEPDSEEQANWCYDDHTGRIFEETSPFALKYRQTSTEELVQSRLQKLEHYRKRRKWSMLSKAQKDMARLGLSSPCARDLVSPEDAPIKTEKDFDVRAASTRDLGQIRWIINDQLENNTAGRDTALVSYWTVQERYRVTSMHILPYLVATGLDKTWVLGLVRCAPSGEQGLRLELYTRKEAQDKGVARVLLNEVMRTILADTALSAVQHIDVHQSYEPQTRPDWLLAWWRRNGFVETGESRLLKDYKRGRDLRCVTLRRMIWPQQRQQPMKTPLGVEESEERWDSGPGAECEGIVW